MLQFETTAMIRISAVLAMLFGIGLTLADSGHSEFLSSGAARNARRALDFKVSLASTDGPIGEDDVHRLGRMAYVWGWPLAYVHQCRAALDRVPSPGRCNGLPVAPPNELSMLTDYLAAGQTVVPCPNQDVVYGYGILDLAREPVVIQVPDFGDRFWVYQLGDQRTDGFAEVGKMYGTKPGLYLVVGPEWQGTTPAEIAGVFRCPTNIGYCVPRVFLDDDAADRAAVLPIVNQIMAYPLSRSSGRMKTCDWSKFRWFPSTLSAGRGKAKWITPETFFDLLPALLAEVPPLAGEEWLYADFRRLLEQASLDARTKQLLVAAAVAAETELLAPLFEFRNLGTQAGYHWTTISNGAAFGVDYLTRAGVAKSNIFVNRQNETKYFYQDLDVAGLRLDGRKSYRVTFAAGHLPPVDGFWSLTLYDEQHAFAPNESGRYSLGTKNKNLRYNPDGSLTIVVQADAPSDAAQTNWLPAPAGKFSLYLRAYAPRPEMLDGRWQPPPVIDAAPQAVARSN
jgi:hypothetical protein